MKLRLFVAVEIDDAVRTLALQAAAALEASGVAGLFEAPEKLHVTVAFLGGAAQRELPAALDALRDASATCRPFTLEFGRIGAFGHEHRPRVWWIGPMQVSEEFAACAGRVREAYERLGYRFEQDATPHVTICRAKHLPPRPPPRILGSATLRVNGLTLFQSLPAGRTTRYEALERTTFSQSL